MTEPAAQPRAAIRRALALMRDDAATWDELHRRYGSYPQLLERLDAYAEMMQEGTRDE